MWLGRVCEDRVWPGRVQSCLSQPPLKQVTGMAWPPVFHVQAGLAGARAEGDERVQEG